MDETGGGSDAVDNAWKVQTHWWWALASAAQLTWAISSYRKGYNGGSHTMPFKALGVASLFIGAGASAGVATLLSCGINKGHPEEDIPHFLTFGSTNSLARRCDTCNHGDHPEL